MLPVSEVLNIEVWIRRTVESDGGHFFVSRSVAHYNVKVHVHVQSMFHFLTSFLHYFHNSYRILGIFRMLTISDTHHVSEN